MFLPTTFVSSNPSTWSVDAGTQYSAHSFYKNILALICLRTMFCLRHDRGLRCSL